MTTPQAPEPLSSIELDLLAAYREAQPMPQTAKASVRERLREGGACSTPVADRNLVRIGIGLAAAAAVLVALWALSPRGTDAGAGVDDGAREQAVFADERASAGGQAQSRTPEPDATRRGSTRKASRSDEPVAAPELAPAPLEPTVEGDDEDTATMVPAEAAPSEAVAPRPRAKRPRPPKAPAPAVAPPAEPTPSPLAQEREILARAWGALARGEAGEAIAIAKTHAERFPSAILAVERRAIERIAACKAKRQGWREKAEAFLDKHGHTPLARKVRDACGDLGDEK